MLTVDSLNAVKDLCHCYELGLKISYIIALWFMDYFYIILLTLTELDRCKVGC